MLTFVPIFLDFNISFSMFDLPRIKISSNVHLDCKAHLPSEQLAH